MHVIRLLLSLGAAALLAAPAVRSAGAAPFLIVGNDEKLLWDDQGKPVIHPAGKDTVVIYDLADPANPKALATLPLKELGDRTAGQCGDRSDELHRARLLH